MPLRSRGRRTGLRPPGWPVPAAIAAAQALLGDHQDSVVAEAWLRWQNVWKRATARKLRR
jgi:hypothetical protein